MTHAWRKNVVWVASYPKSGNTWVRSILYCAMQGKVDLNRIGELIPSFPACVERVAQDNRIAEIDDAAKLWDQAQQWISSLPGNRVIKTHNLCGPVSGTRFPLSQCTLAAIYVVRDPRDVAISYTNHFGRTLEQAVSLLQMEDNFTFMEANTFRKSVIGSWRTHVESWMGAAFPVLVVRYEDLLMSPVDEISRILDFLGMKPVISPERIADVTSFSSLSRSEAEEGFDEASENAVKFFHKGRVGQWLGREQEVQDLNLAFGPLMKTLGYEF